MQTYTPKQLQSAAESGGIKSVTVTAQGANFYIQIVSRTGDGVLTKARSRDPRAFSNPLHAFSELRRVGIRSGAFDTTQWSPEQRETRTRPDRSRAMSKMHAMADHARWVDEMVSAAQAEAADPATEWVEQSVIDADTTAQRQRIEKQIADD
jgi:hypothetical protein